MTQTKLIIGVDISADTFTWTTYNMSEKTYSHASTFDNKPSGFEKLHYWCAEKKLNPDEVVFCLENTGVYGEALSHWMAARGYPVAIEAPHKVKRAFKTIDEKTDELDSRQIAEYALRYFDDLHFWSPPKEILEHLRVLLSTREQYVTQITAHRNTLHQYAFKVVKTPVVEASLHQVIDVCRQQVKKIDEEIAKHISKDSHIGPLHALITSVPGVGTLLASQLILMTRGFEEPAKPKTLANYLGIAPLKRQSGRTLNKRPRSRGYGPSTARKLLYLAAMSVRTHKPAMRHYFIRKVESGKPKRLVLNNIENKLIRIICAVVNSRTPFINNYKSIHPMFVNTA